MEDGYIFQRLPAPHQGLRCARNFVADQRRKTACEKHLGLKGLSFYSNSSSCATFAGELRMAVEFIDEALDVKPEVG